MWISEAAALAGVNVQTIRHDERRARIDQKIAELDRVRKALGGLVHACHAGTTLECPIIEALDSESGS